MDIRTMMYYRTICECLSYRKAADKLHVSQPSLSAAISRMEEELNVLLLYRDNKGVKITREGAVFYHETCEILDRISDVMRRLNDMKEEESKKLTLAFPSTSGAWLWPELLEGFQKDYPQIELDLFDMSSFDILRGIQRDELEIGYSVLDIDIPDDIQTRVVFEDEVKLITGKDDSLALKETVSLGMLEGRRIAMYNEGSSYCEAVFLRLLRENEIRADILYVSQQSSVFNLVAQGLAVAVILDDIELVRNNSQISICTLDPPIPFKCGFMWKKNRYLSESAKKLLDYFG